MPEQSFWEKIKPLGKYVAETAKNVAVGIGSEYKKAFTEKGPEGSGKEVAKGFLKEAGSVAADIPRYALRGITSVGMDLFGEKEFQPDKSSWAEKALYGEEKLKSFSTRMKGYDETIRKESGFDSSDKFPTILAAGLTLGGLWADTSLGLTGSAKNRLLKEVIQKVEKETGEKVSKDMISKLANKVNDIHKNKNIADKGVEMDNYVKSFLGVDNLEKRKAQLEDTIRRNGEFMPDEQIELSQINKKIRDFNDGKNIEIDDVVDISPKQVVKTKEVNQENIIQKFKDIQLKRDVDIKDIHGNKIKLTQGEALTPYELKGGKVLLQDGETYIVNKNQFQNIKGQSVVDEAKKFAPELDDLEEVILGKKPIVKSAENIAWERYGKPSWELTGEQKLDIDNELKKIKENIVEQTTYHSYTLPDGQNYREVLIKAPNNMEAKGWKFEPKSDGGVDVINPEGLNLGRYSSKESALDSFKYYGDSGNFKSSHWEEPNVISHLRLNDRTYNGKKVTFMEELQSDWAREGRSKGFAQDMTEKTKITDSIKKYPVPKDEGDWSVIVLKENGVPEELADRWYDFNIADLNTVPNHPLLKNWQEPTIKRALKDAVDNDAEYFSWINGEQTSARYNLATYIDDVRWNKYPSGIKDVNLKAKKGNNIEFQIDKDGKVMGSAKQPDWNGKKLDEVLGKGLADKIMEKETGTLAGDGLKFGGEWASNLYDKQVKNIVEKLTGQKVETIDLGLPVEKKAGTISLVEDGDYLPLGYKQYADKVKVGSEINVAKSIQETGENYIVTDILGEGKFNAVPKDLFDGQVKSKQPKSSLEKWKEIIDISQKTSTQQAIKLTPEVKAIIKGESPLIKKPGGKNLLSDETGSATIGNMIKIGVPLATLAFFASKGETEGKEKFTPSPGKYMDLTGYINPPVNMETKTSQNDGNGIIKAYNNIKEKKTNKKPLQISDDQKNKVIATIIGEGMGEGKTGLHAVLNNIVNRAEKNYRGSNLFDVVSAGDGAQYNAFSTNNQLYIQTLNYLEGKAEPTMAVKNAVETVKTLIDKYSKGELEDITAGNLNYLNPAATKESGKIASGYNKRDPKKDVIIGNHVFWSN